jgi:hypothetical protein
VHKGYPLELKQKIITAFRNVKHPGKKKVGGVTQEDSEAFGNKRWDEIRRGDMALMSVGVNWFTPAGFQYFVPAYLVHIITHPDDSLIALLLIEALATYDEQKQNKARGSVLCKNFTRQQKDVIIEFISYFPTLTPYLFTTQFKNNAYFVAQVEAKKASWAKALEYWQACNE